MKTLRIQTLLLTALITAAALPAQAGKADYEVIPVNAGGAITGTVHFQGDPPPPIMEDLNKGKNSEFCIQHPDTLEGGIRPRTKVRVTEGKLAGAVVFIENITRGKDWNPDAIRFDFQNCDIFPKVSVVRKAPKGMKEGLVQIVNQDLDILHNPHGYSKVGANAKTLFNKPLPSKGDVADVTTSLKRLKEKKDSHFFLQCDQHNFMEADARVVWNPYYQVTGTDGAFKLDQVPAGTYKVSVWHPYVGEVTQEITVKDGQTVNTDFKLAMK